MKPIHYRDTPAIKACYDENGVVLVDGVYTEDQLSQMEQFFEDFKNEKAIFDGSEHYTEEVKAQRQVRALHPHRFSSQVKTWFLEPRVAHVLEALFGRPALGAQTMYYYKPPGASGQAMHQDNHPLATKPAACIGVWSPIDDADEDNGCLRVALGSHKLDIFCAKGTLARNPYEYGDSHISQYPREYPPVAIPVKRGQTLFFHGHTIHGSGPNRTQDRYRRTFIGHYVDQTTEEIAEFYHPILNMQGEVVSGIAIGANGGLC
ncbi:phytanoyl-CoA dioxygenase family protein [Cerasicoccus fimbriatus]|uniref:phytanoyl-CoA dioxygenase family protein n=1 Tax=Cerasicoccus fimbriatus TaxID=3014554 RepID=UPI0022B52F98|nr:phytanoyl-CoA dioxygenase family protein [Cerasicoccus sp. TK19100]